MQLVLNKRNWIGHLLYIDIQLKRHFIRLLLWCYIWHTITKWMKCGGEGLLSLYILHKFTICFLQLATNIRGVISHDQQCRLRKGLAMVVEQSRCEHGDELATVWGINHFLFRRMRFSVLFLSLHVCCVFRFCFKDYTEEFRDISKGKSKDSMPGGIMLINQRPVGEDSHVGFTFVFLSLFTSIRIN